MGGNRQNPSQQRPSLCPICETRWALVPFSGYRVCHPCRDQLLAQAGIVERRQNSSGHLLDPKRPSRWTGRS